MTHTTDPKLLIKKIQRVLSPELLQKKWRGSTNPLAGHCYVASEALYHLLGGSKAGVKACSAQCPGGVHWWIELNGWKLDPTSSQFDPQTLEGIYAQGRGRGFLTCKPSKRAQVIIDRVLGY